MASQVRQLRHRHGFAQEILEHCGAPFEHVRASARRGLLVDEQEIATFAHVAGSQPDQASRIEPGANEAALPVALEIEHRVVACADPSQRRAPTQTPPPNMPL
jgi:hypothetical protein